LDGNNPGGDGQCVGAALAFLIYKEKDLVVRISGALLITASLLLIADVGD
jgi:hypothetical protein